MKLILRKHPQRQEDESKQGGAVPSTHRSTRGWHNMTRDLQEQHSSRKHSSNMLYLDSVVGERRAALPPVPLWRTPTPSPPMRKDRGLGEAETKKAGETFSDSRSCSEALPVVNFQNIQRMKRTAWCARKHSSARCIITACRDGTSVSLTSKLDWGLLADEGAVLVGGQTGVLSYVLVLNGVANDQVASH